MPRLLTILRTTNITIEGQRCKILTLKKVFLIITKLSDTVSHLRGCFLISDKQNEQCIILSKSGVQFDDSQDFGVEKWEKSNTCHEMCPMWSYPLFLAIKNPLESCQLLLFLTHTTVDTEFIS